MILPQALTNFLSATKSSPLIDVRSEGEFAQGHIPGAHNLPLLNNEERAIVGTLYKQKGNEAAVQKGFELVGGKFAAYISQAKELAHEKQVSLYCWRGGLRSNIMAWLFSTAGLQVNLLKGGYKSFRTHALESFSVQRNYLILGGKTGSGKTEMLQHLANHKEQVIDLEGLAHHKGSAFGGIGQAPQPSNEQFENEIYVQLQQLNAEQAIWLENESRLIGTNKIPDAIYAQMRNAPVIEMLVPIELRIVRIVRDYGCFPIEILEETTRKIEKKLGNLRMKKAIEHLHQGEINLWAHLMLEYYDDFYAYGMSQRKPESIRYVELNSDNYSEEVNKILHLNGNN